MTKPNYDRKKVRRAMLAAPAVALLGLAPFVIQLDLTFMQFLFATVAALVVSYVLAVLVGYPGYLALRHFGYAQTKYLMIYAVLVVLATPLLLDDVYALLSFGPPMLLAAGAFCYLRGPIVLAKDVDAKEDAQEIESPAQPQPAQT
jgi:hypothetical protein